MTQSAIKPVPPTMPGGTGAYADVNGLHMYYETNGGAGRPLVLLHGGLSATETSFGKLLPGLGPNRRLIAVEQQAHGRTADIDRPLSLEQMADDTAALLRQIGVEQADFFFGDSDIVRPEHAVEMFRLFGGGVPGDVVPMPKSQLAVLPGTSHITLVHRAEWLVPMITAFLDN